MTDLIDKASDVEEICRQASISHALAAIDVKSSRQSLLYCLHCGYDIAEARRQAVQGVTTCLDCALELELKQKKGVQ